MTRYLEDKGLRTRLAEIYGPGSRVDFLSRETRIFAWGERGAPSSPRVTSAASTLKATASTGSVLLSCPRRHRV